jgi:acyl-homoserine lactone acylase PvdQ
MSSVWFRSRTAALVAMPVALVLSIACARPETGAAAAAEGSTSDLPGSDADSGKTVLYRDTWGVPHIYAPTVAAGLYAQGWAQAEDRPQQLLLNLMMGLGEFASVVGESGIEVDVRSHLWDHLGMAKRGFAELPSEIREHLEAYVAGINDWYAAHPEDVPEWWHDRKVDPYMVVAFSRLFVYNWSIDERRRRSSPSIHTWRGTVRRGSGSSASMPASWWGAGRCSPARRTWATDTTARWPGR